MSDDPPLPRALAPVAFAPTTAADPPTAAGGLGETQISDRELETFLDALSTSAPLATRYEPLGLLGTGGMGEVRLVLDRRIGRHVARKVLRPGVTASHARARFVREALIQAQLEHPGIVPVYDVASDEGIAFTMRRVRGATLAQVIELLAAGDPEAAKKYSRHKLLSAFLRVCETVHFAHARGVLHRDLKPANVMLGDFGEVYVLDWGIAKVTTGGQAHADRPQVDDAAATLRGTILGTPGYMAPEQIEGGAADERSDVYALGVILYELLALSPLHRGDTSRALLASALKGADARPSRQLRGRDVPPELDAICVRATERIAEERFPSVDALREHLERFLEGDRDLERRRAQSLELVERAAAAADAATTLEKRNEAMRDVGRALALDPENRGAVRLLVRLMTEAPKEMPEEVEREIDAAENDVQRARARFGALAYVTWFACIPVFVLMGLKSVTALALGSLAWGAAAVALYASAGATSPARSVAARVFAALATASSSVVFGPLVVVPGLAALSTVGMSLSRRRGLSGPLTPLLFSAAMIVPLAFEWLGFLPKSYVFTSDMLCVVPRMVAFSEAQTYAFLVVVQVFIVAITYFWGTRIRRVLSDLHRRVYFSAWQARQLLPDPPPQSGEFKA